MSLHSTQEPRTLRPLWYFRLPNFASLTSTILPGPPILGVVVILAAILSLISLRCWEALIQFSKMDIGYSRELGLGAVKSRLKWTMEWTEMNILTNEWLREASRSYFCSCFMLPRSVWTENFVSVFEVRTYLSIYYFGFESRGFIFLMLSRKVGFFFAVWARKRELCLQRYVWVETQLINCGVTKMLYSKTEGSN